MRSIQTICGFAHIAIISAKWANYITYSVWVILRDCKLAGPATAVLKLFLAIYTAMIL